MNKFKELGLDKSTLDVIEKLGYTTPTDIQKESIPLIIKGRDIIAQSATGTGKTFAFLSGILPNLYSTKELQAIVVAPTRELANQIFSESKRLFKSKNIRSCVVYGGEPIYKQKKELAKSEVVITTPGRILDHLERKYVSFKNIKILVLDEADRMCDMGFYTDIKKIMENCPKNIQRILFSATINNDVTKLEKKYMNNAKRIVVEYYVDKNKLLQEYYKVKPDEKISLLVNLIQSKTQKSLVFCNRRSMVDLVCHNLKENDIKNVFKLHGGLEQRTRTNTIEKYLNSDNSILVSTDVSARGIHINDLDYIYNFDIPESDKQYIHRIGRTARAGKEGKAISIIIPKEERLLLSHTKNFILKKMENPNFKKLPLKKVIKTESKQESKNKNFHERKRNKVYEDIKKIKEKEEKGNLKKEEYYKKKEEKFQKKRRTDFRKQKLSFKKKRYAKKQ